MERRGVAWRPPPGIQRTKNVEGRSYWTVSPPVANRISFNHCQIRRGGARSAPRKKRGVTGDAFAKQPETLPIPLSKPVDDRDDSIWQRVFLERTVQGFPFPVHFLASRRLIETGTRVSNKGEAFCYGLSIRFRFLFYLAESLSGEMEF